LGTHLSKEGEWTDEMKETWQAALEVVSNIMIEAGNDPDKFKEEMKDKGYEPNGFKKDDPRPWVLA
jgi:hypothetical protein